MRFPGEFAMRRCVGRSCGPDDGMKPVRQVARTRSRLAVGIHGCSNEHESLREDEHLWYLRGIIASYRPPWLPLTNGRKTWRDIGLRAMSMYEISRRIRHSRIRRAVVWPGFWDEACAFRRAHEIPPGGRDLLHGVQGEGRGGHFF